MKTINITTKTQLEQAIKFVMENGRGKKEIETDLLNCHISLERGIELYFTSIKHNRE